MLKLNFSILNIQAPHHSISTHLFPPWPLPSSQFFVTFSFFKKKFFNLLLERQEGKEGAREGEKQKYMVAFHMPPTRDPARNPGMRPDWESNHDLLVRSLALNPLSHTSQGVSHFLEVSVKWLANRADEVFMGYNLGTQPLTSTQLPCHKPS